MSHNFTEQFGAMMEKILSEMSLYPKDILVFSLKPKFIDRKSEKEKYLYTKNVFLKGLFIHLNIYM